MKHNLKINENLILELTLKRKRTILAIYENKKRIVLSDNKTDYYFWSGFRYDKNYIVVYTSGCMVNQIPINIEAVYDIKEKRLLDLSDEKLKLLIQYMYISKKGFDLTNILTFLNKADLKLLKDEYKDDLKRILTAGNSKITDKEVLEYIFKNYPELKLAKYRNLKGPLTVIEYKNIQNELGQENFRFHLMPQNLNSIEELNLEDIYNYNQNYFQPDISEYKNKQKKLSLKK